MPLLGVKPLTSHIVKLTLPLYSSIPYMAILHIWLWSFTRICDLPDASAAELSAHKHTHTQSKPVHHFTFCHRFFIKGTTFLCQHFPESFFLTIQRNRNETRAQLTFSLSQDKAGRNLVCSDIYTEWSQFPDTRICLLISLRLAVHLSHKIYNKQI